MLMHEMVEYGAVRPYIIHLETWVFALLTCSISSYLCMMGLIYCIRSRCTKLPFSGWRLASPHYCVFFFPPMRVKTPDVVHGTVYCGQRHFRFFAFVKYFHLCCLVVSAFHIVPYSESSVLEGFWKQVVPRLSWLQANNSYISPLLL